MGVSKNSGIPKWMVYNGKPYQNGWFGGKTHYFRKHPNIQTCINAILVQKKSTPQIPQKPLDRFPRKRRFCSSSWCQSSSSKAISKAWIRSAKPELMTTKRSSPTHMDVSENSGTPKIIHFGVPLFVGNTHIIHGMIVYLPTWMVDFYGMWWILWATFVCKSVR